ncbi:MAG: hypothetical protein K2K41_00305 [Ruminiclostridium sp.]|nr:hypothetical protein [Ruminiclostridium sp.]
MNEDLFFKMVQEQIGDYKFKNLNLLKQAFVRRSYTEENGGENNEVLEFIGDKALDFAVVRLFAQKFGQLNENNEFVCCYNEKELTRLKSKMVEKKTLARRIDELGFAEGLIMGKSDIQNNVNDEPSVKEDLFEAILGAVSVDSNWNLKEIQSAVEVMLEPDTFLQDDSETNYVRLIQEWEMQMNGVLPWYKYKEASYTSTWYIPFDGISQNIPWDYDYSKLHFHCELKLLDKLPIFRGFGSSKSEARMAVCKLAYEYLEKHNMLFSIRDEIDNPNKADAINQLEILARRGYFSIPTYKFEQKYDNNGNPIWICECHIQEYDTYYNAKSSSKKDAKKTAAFKMLEYVLNEEE